MIWKRKLSFSSSGGGSFWGLSCLVQEDKAGCRNWAVISHYRNGRDDLSPCTKIISFHSCPWQGWWLKVKLAIRCMGMCSEIECTRQMRLKGREGRRSQKLCPPLLSLTFIAGFFSHCTLLSRCHCKYRNNNNSKRKNSIQDPNPLQSLSKWTKNHPFPPHNVAKILVLRLCQVLRWRKMNPVILNSADCALIIAFGN